MTRGTTRGLCADAHGALIPFKDGLRMLGYARSTAEEWLRDRDPRLPTVFRLGDRRFFLREVIERELEKKAAQVAQDWERIEADRQALATRAEPST